MSAYDHLVSEWKQRRAELLRQLRSLEATALQTRNSLADQAAAEMIERIKYELGEIAGCLRKAGEKD